MRLAKLSLCVVILVPVGAVSGSIAACSDPMGPRCNTGFCLSSCCPGYRCQIAPGTDPPSGTCVWVSSQLHRGLDPLVSAQAQVLQMSGQQHQPNG